MATVICCMDISNCKSWQKYVRIKSNLRFPATAKLYPITVIPEVRDVLKDYQ